MGRIGNVDLNALANPENPASAFIVPKTVNTTGCAAVDSAIAATQHAGTEHTLNGQDWNNVAPRLGLAWTPDGGKSVMRGGYGVKYRSDQQREGHALERRHDAAGRAFDQISELQGPGPADAADHR